MVREQDKHSAAALGEGNRMSVIASTVSALRRAAGVVANLLPEPPSRDSERPDIDGKRQADLNPEDLRRVQRARKEGKGGYR